MPGPYVMVHPRPNSSRTRNGSTRPERFRGSVVPWFGATIQLLGTTEPTKKHG